MVDFEGGKRSGFELDNGAEDTVEGASSQFQDNGASYSPGTIIRSADANGVVVLPAGVSPEDITVQGRDLVINLADGSTIVIPDGAIIVPQIVIEDVAIDPATLAALLNAEAIDPEAGPQQARARAATSLQTRVRSRMPSILVTSFPIPNFPSRSPKSAKFFQKSRTRIRTSSSRRPTILSA